MIENLWYDANIRVKGEVTKERVVDNIVELSNYVAYWREYPDKLIDYLTPEESNFSLYFYQRLFLRIIFRYPYTYATFTRAYSKSFLSVLGLLIRCILYPRIKLFISSGTKKQAASIAKEKLDEIFYLIPQLEKEVTTVNKGADYVEIFFKNGSNLNIVGVANSTRGGQKWPLKYSYCLSAG